MNTVPLSEPGSLGTEFIWKAVKVLTFGKNDQNLPSSRIFKNLTVQDLKLQWVWRTARKRWVCHGNTSGFEGQPIPVFKRSYKWGGSLLFVHDDFQIHVLGLGFSIPVSRRNNTFLLLNALCLLPLSLSSEQPQMKLKQKLLAPKWPSFLKKKQTIHTIYLSIKYICVFQTQHMFVCMKFIYLFQKHMRTIQS